MGILFRFLGWVTGNVQTVVVAVVAAIIIGGAVDKCSDNKKAFDQATIKIAQLELDTVRIHNKYIRADRDRLLCLNETERSRSYVYRAKANIEAGERKVNQAVAGRSPKQQHVSVVKGLVDTRALPASRLRDTVYTGAPVVVDTQLVAAVDRITGWYQLYRDSTSLLLGSVGSLAVRIETLENQNQDCSDALDKANRDIADRRQRGFIGRLLCKVFGCK